MIDLELGSLARNQSVTFTLYFGAAPDEQTALDAVTDVGAALYSLAQYDPTLGTPSTFINAYKASA